MKRKDIKLMISPNKFHSRILSEKELKTSMKLAKLEKIPYNHYIVKLIIQDLEKRGFLVR